MAKQIERLTDAKIRRLTAPGRYHDGAGLYFAVTKSGSRSWLYQFVLHGRQRWHGLGPYPTVSLKEARQAAGEARKLVRQKIDPIEARRVEQERQRLADARAVTFKAVAEEYVGAHKTSWQNAKHRQQWENTLQSYVYPKIGDLPVGDISIDHVLEILKSLWSEKPETASRVRQRIEAILSAATAKGLRTGANPAAWRGHLDRLLPRRSKVATVRNHPAMHYSDLPTFWETLSTREAMSAKALAFAILTAARSGEVRGATWQEIDLDADVWTIPAARMKSRRPHRVPLSDAAIGVLRSVRPKDAKPNDIVFPGLRGGPMSDATARKYLQSDLKLPDVVPHGFRSTFRSWVAECTGFAGELAEAALAHVVGGVEGVYQRSDQLERRREMMAAWSAFCTGGAERGQVVQFNRSNQL